MAMDVGGAKGGLKADINVTPLVDVMLVLLIIMMLIAPMLQQGVAVTLPEAGNTEPKPDTQDQTVVAIPAVWFYNYLTGRIEYFNVEMDNSSSELLDYFIKKTA